MNNRKSLRDQAKRCRILSTLVAEPEVIEQLRVWSVELVEEADKVEWATEENDPVPSASDVEQDLVEYQRFNADQLRWFSKASCPHAILSSSGVSFGAVAHLRRSRD
jgi:hypothetical protein